MNQLKSTTGESTADDEVRTVSDVTGLGCDCSCDDFVVTVTENSVSSVEHGCTLGADWFFGSHNEQLPEAVIDGVAVSYDEAIERAVEILWAARSPICYGLSAATTETQRVAVAIADWIGGTVDAVNSTLTGGALTLAMQRVGEVTATWGEIDSRADFLICWGGDSFLSNNQLLLGGEWLSEKRRKSGRRLVVIDVQKTAAAEAADWFLQVKPGAGVELAWAIRGLLKGVAIDPSIEDVTGVSLEQLQEVVAAMRTAEYGALLFDSAWDDSAWDDFESDHSVPDAVLNSHHLQLFCEAMLLLVRDLNANSRWVSRAFPKSGNGVGAENVLCSSTGFPFGVNFGCGYPRFNGGEFTAAEMLENRDVDAALFVGGAADWRADFSEEARERLAAIPSILFASTKDFESNRLVGYGEPNATVLFTTATYGIHTGGTVYRSDNVPLPLRPVLTTRFRGAADLLKEIEMCLCQKITEREKITKSVDGSSEVSR